MFTAWWREHVEVLAISALYILSVWLALRRLHAPTFTVWPSVNLSFLGLIAIGGIVLAAARFGSRRSLRPVALAVPGALTFGLLAPWILVAFSAWKQALLNAVPFDWDPALHAISVAIHGQPEFRYFSWVYASPLLLLAVDRFYAIGWALGSVATFVALAWLPDRIVRKQFLIATLLAWVLLGSVGAAIFGSGGPMFYGLLVPGPDPYADLLQQLRGQPGLIAVQVADLLTSIIRTRQWQVFGGISAMPSLHVAQATLTALLCRTSQRRWVQAAGLLYLLLIMVGSVVLGWHYAIDGYVSIAATAAIVWLSGRYTRRPRALGSGAMTAQAVRIASAAGDTHQTRIEG